MTSSAAVRKGASLRTRNGLLHGPVLTLAVGLCAAVPVIAAMGRALHEGWQPVADRGIIATRSFDVLSSHMPLVGQYSFAGAVTGKLTYSLGPMLYWLLAPAAHVGAPGSFVVTMTLVNVGCVLGAVALARRRGGMWLMVAAAVGIGLMCRSIAANNFYDIWNPSAGLFPLLALIFVGWSVACGDYRLLPVAALLASFEVQCEDSFLPPALGVSGVALAGLLWWVRARGARASTPSAAPASTPTAAPASAPTAAHASTPTAAGEAPSARTPRVWLWALAASVVLAICWTPTVVDQVGHEGNFVHVVQAASKRRSSLGATVGVRAVVRTVGVRPWWLVRPSDPFVRKHDVRHSAGSLANGTAAVIIGWLLLASVLAIRRRRYDIAAGVATALIGCLAVYATASATPTKRMLAETLGYTMWSASMVGMFTWLIALWAAVVLSRVDERLAAVVRTLASRARSSPRAWRPLAGGAAVALAALVGGAGATAGTPDEHAFEFAALANINSRLGSVPRGHSVFLNARLDGLITPLRPELSYDLRRRGVRPLGNGAYLRTGHWYERSEHRYDYVVWVYDNRRLPAPGARVIATTHITTGGHPHVIEVAISPVTPRTRAASRTLVTPGARAASRTLAASRSRAAAPAAPAPIALVRDVVGRAGTHPPTVWSAPRTLDRCALPTGPRVAFPSKSPSAATGPGAIVWLSRSSCGTSAPPPSAATLFLAPFGPGDRLEAPRAVAVKVVPAGGVAAVGGSFGQIAVATGGERGTAASGQSMFEGDPRRPGEFSEVGAVPASMGALARAYLGDTAFAILSGTTRARHRQTIDVFVVRFFQHESVDPPRRLDIPAGQVSALTATMDFRSDVLLAWQQNGYVYAHMLRASGRVDPTQRLGPSAPDPQLRALVSDNDHGMVAWSSTAGGRTSVYIDLSSAGVRFTAPRRLASFADPAHVGEGSLGLVRLSGENVLLAWTAADHGHYIVRAAPAVYAGRRAPAVVSDTPGQAILGDLAPGPANEAIAVWRAAPTAGFLDLGRTSLWSARVFIGRGDRPVVRAPQPIAPPGPVSDPAVAVDPASDRAVATWLTGRGRPTLEYSVTRPAAGTPSGGEAVSAGGGTDWLAPVLAGAAAMVAVLAALVARRRRGRVR